MNWNFPGLAIIWSSLNHFNAIFRSDWRFAITFTDLGQLYVVLLSAKLRISGFSTNYNMSFKKILKNWPRLESHGKPKRIFNHELKVESSLTLCVWMERLSSKSLRLFTPTLYACSFAKTGSWARQSNALKRSIRIVRTSLELSRQLCHLLFKFSNACWVLYLERKPRKRGDNLFS